jgi:hypothetical protein
VLAFVKENSGNERAAPTFGTAQPMVPRRLAAVFVQSVEMGKTRPPNISTLLRIAALTCNNDMLAKWVRLRFPRRFGSRMMG